jgi:protein-S-isoprenylcysteine O-methyltransferase Ste14
LWKLIVLTAGGFALLVLHDMAQIRQQRILKLLGAGGYLLIAAVYGAILSSSCSLRERVIFPIAAALFAVLLVYSVLLEIPIRHRGSSTGSAYTRGTYRLSRHPGFIWMVLMNTALLFWCPQEKIVLGFLTLCNLLLITVEDRIIFPRLFTDYSTYRQEVPFFFRILPKKR